MVVVEESSEVRESQEERELSKEKRSRHHFHYEEWGVVGVGVGG